MSFTIELTEEQLKQLKQRAMKLNLTAEQLVAASVQNLLSEEHSEPKAMEFSNAMEYVMKKNRELYRRLA